jgi:DNA-binding transcriptional LysR family regulator
MDLDDVRVFVACAREGSVSAAARACGISQPAATRQIQRLEREFGFELLCRQGRPLRPTPAGAEILAWAEHTLARLDAALARLRQGGPALAGPLRVAASSIPGEFLAPGLLAAFAARHPGVEPCLSVSDSAGAVAALLAGDADVAFIGAPVARPPLRLQPICEDELVLVIPAGHRLAGRAEVLLEELAGEAFVEREGGSGTMESLRRLLRARGLALPPHRIALRAGSTQSQVAAVRAGAGLAFVSARAAGRANGVSVARLAGIPLYRQLYLCYHPARYPPAAQAFVAFARERAGATAAKSAGAA